MTRKPTKPTQPKIHEYNGKRKWSAPTRTSDLIEMEPPLGDYAIAFQ
jgi:hypothetical protein